METSFLSKQTKRIHNFKNHSGGNSKLSDTNLYLYKGMIYCARYGLSIVIDITFLHLKYNSITK